MGTTTGPIKVSQATKEKVRLAAAVSGRTQAELVKAAVDEYLERHTSELASGIRRVRATLVGIPDRPRITLGGLRERRKDILEVARRHGARSVRVFGSAASTTGSAWDVDLLVGFETGRSLLDLVALIEDLEALLDLPVDVVEPEGLHPSIRDEVLAEAVEL